MQPIVPNVFQVARLLIPVPLRFLPEVPREFKMILRCSCGVDKAACLCERWPVALL